MTSVKQKNRAAYPVDKVGGHRQTDGRTDGRTRPNSIVPTFFKCWGLKIRLRRHRLTFAPYRNDLSLSEYSLLEIVKKGEAISKLIAPVACELSALAL